MLQIYYSIISGQYWFYYNGKAYKIKNPFCDAAIADSIAMQQHHTPDK
jgi:hypothetical protein